MPTIQVESTVPLNGTVNNALADNQYEFLPWNALIEFGIVAAAPGVVADVYSGSDTLIESGAISSANRTPVYPDDFTLTDVAAAGERLKVRLRNTTGAAILVRTIVRLTPQ